MFNSDLQKRMYRATANHGVFNTMLKAALRSNSKFEVEGVFNQWWKVAFPDRQFVGMSFFKLKNIIDYKLLYDGYVNQEIMISKKFLSNYNAIVLGKGEVSKIWKMLETCQSLSEIESTIIQPLKEGQMASGKKSVVLVKKGKKAGSAVERKSGATVTRDAVCRMIVAQKFTNEEIAKETGADEKTIGKMFRQLNKGKRKGFEKPKSSYERIVEVNGKKIKKQDVPKKEKSSKKVDPKKDPLMRTAGINVHGKKKAVPAKKKTVPAKKKGTSAKKKTATKSRVRQV